MCVLVWLGAEGSRMPLQGGVSCGGSYLLNLSVCSCIDWRVLLTWKVQLEGVTFLFFSQSASYPHFRKLFACLSICSKIFSSVFSLSCAACRFFSSCYKNIVNVVEKRFWQKEREEILVLMHDSAKSKCSACGQVLCKHLHLQSCFQVQRDLFSICLCAFIFILSLHRFSTKHSGGIKFYKKCGFLALFLWGASEVGSSMRKAMAQQRKESWAKIWEYF